MAGYLVLLLSCKVAGSLGCALRNQGVMAVEGSAEGKVKGFKKLIEGSSDINPNNPLIKSSICGHRIEELKL